MAINKVVYGANTLIDLTADTVTADTLKTGFTAHDKSGTAITGTLDLAEGSVYQDEDGCVVLNDDDGSGVSYIPLTVSSNGTYTASSSYCYNPVTVNVDAQYYSIYKSLAFRSVIKSSATGVSEWANSLSKIVHEQFANQRFSGSLTFGNASVIETYGFAFAYTNTNIGGGADTTRFIFPNVSNISTGAFAYNNNIRGISCSSCKQINDNAFLNCIYLSDISFPVCSIVGESAFEGCLTLSDIAFPSCQILSRRAFSSCQHLSTISFPICENIGSYAFYSCNKLEAASFPSCSIVGSYAFYSCNSLANISFPICENIGNSAFYSCNKLETASFPSCSIIGSYAFFGCSSLTSISFPICENIGERAFINCRSLTEASFPSCSIVGSYAFYSCSSLTSISFSSCSIVGSYAFGYCSSLTEVSFPKCETIYGSAFLSCTSLRVVSFPKCISIIGAVFSSCIALESAYFLGSSVPSLSTTYAFSSTPLKLSSYLGHFGSIFVRQSLLESFLSNVNWNTYSSRFVGLTDAQIAALDAS